MGGGLTSGTNIPLQEVEVKIGGRITCQGGLMAGFYGTNYAIRILTLH